VEALGYIGNEGQKSSPGLKKQRRLQMVIANGECIVASSWRHIFNFRFGTWHSIYARNGIVFVDKSSYNCTVRPYTSRSSHQYASRSSIISSIIGCHSRSIHSNISSYSEEGGLKGKRKKKGSRHVGTCSDWKTKKTVALYSEVANPRDPDNTEQNKFGPISCLPT